MVVFLAAPLLPGGLLCRVSSSALSSSDRAGVGYSDGVCDFRSAAQDDAHVSLLSGGDWLRHFCERCRKRLERPIDLWTTDDQGRLEPDHVAIDTAHADQHSLAQ